MPLLYWTKSETKVKQYEAGRWFKADVVFEDGGVKDIGLTGVLEVAEEHGYQWENLAGTSAGGKKEVALITVMYFIEVKLNCRLRT